ncbi:MAG TPA: alpha/beta hydrolase [Caulobacteraceae bacterium]|nr:alpha/beta hydrolase [Caulobacteraceae bacterium]
MDRYARPQRLVKINRRRRLNLYVSGEGAPTVILFGGGACGPLYAARVQSRLQRTCRVVSFDRAGSGFSDPGPLPRTTARLVADLRTALNALSIGPPYVAVGHSQGSFDCRLFAFLHPDEVVGMVLVDPRGDRAFERLTAAVPRLAGRFLDDQRRLHRNAVIARRRPRPGTPDYEALALPPNPNLTAAVNQALLEERLRPAYWRANASEQLSLLNGSSQGEVDRARRHLGNLPLILLSARRQDRPDLSAEENDAEWAARAEMHRELVALSSLGFERHVPDSSHDTPLDRPDAVAEAVLEVIAAAAASGNAHA